MCYDHGESIPILSTKWVIARKDHECSECWRKVIKKGQPHQVSTGVDRYEGGAWARWRVCEECHYFAACIYAIERAEGCEPWESMVPMGSGYLREDMVDRGIYPPGHLDDHSMEDLDDMTTRPVMRWWEIDAGGREAARV
jgi:hypothetical protein